MHELFSYLKDPLSKCLFYGIYFKTAFTHYFNNTLQKYTYADNPNPLKNGLVANFQPYSSRHLPIASKLATESGKLKTLDTLLPQLHSTGHRCLIFCQMTKMLDILEDYLTYRKYEYFRMDGSSSIADRRDMVDEFQENSNIFCFLLSTRAGGLGVNLTGADTVIFYDNDWNPTMDAQATDRVHRIGQTKKVTIYRLITKNTVEEKIVKRAGQKETVQRTVYSGGAFNADVFKPREVYIYIYILYIYIYI